MEGIFIRINKLNEFNPRTDRKTHYWMRVDINIATSRALHKLTADQRWFFICLVAMAVDVNNERVGDKEKYVEFDVDYFHKITGVSHEQIAGALDVLRTNKTISFVHEDGEELNASAPFDAKNLQMGAYIHTDITNKQTIPAGDLNLPLGNPTQPKAAVIEIPIKPQLLPPQPTVNDSLKFENRSKFQFRDLVDSWPKQTNKNRAMEKLARDIGTQELFDKLTVATKNAIKYHQERGTEYQYIPSYASFLDGWEDHLIAIPKPTIEFKGRVSVNERSHTSMPVEKVMAAQEEYGKRLEEEAPKPTDQELKTAAEALKRRGIKLPKKLEGEL